MKIISLQAENVKRLVAVEIKPDGNMVVISGKNGQGKTSVLDSIWWALAGAGNIQTTPIRKGAEEAKITLDLGPLKVIRTFRHSKDGTTTTSIAVENAEGARFPKPQAQIDALLGSLSFDPLGFARMEAKEQFEALKRFVPDVDFTAIANADRGDRERRTEINRLEKQERAAAALITTPADTPEEELDETALVGELEAAGRVNAELEQRRANRERLAREAEGHRAKAKSYSDEITDLRERINELEQQQAAASDRAVAIDKQLNDAGALPAPVDTAPIRKRIEGARATNANVRRLNERMKHHTIAEELKQKSETLTAQIEKRQTDKEASIAKAQMPVPGLGFGEGVVLFNALPFDQASDAEQLRVSVAIAAALNPKLRVIRVRDGSLLDEDGMKLLAELAEKTDMQIWVERVDSSGAIGFVLEDGHVKAEAENVAND